MKIRFFLIETFSLEISFFHFLFFIIQITFILPIVFDFQYSSVLLIFFILQVFFVLRLISYFIMKFSSRFSKLIFFNFCHLIHLPTFDFMFDFKQFKVHFFNYYSRIQLINVYSFFYFICSNHCDFELEGKVAAESQVI